ncbi:MAG TPA: helix-turn-helix domain-containing protein [Patescibacteria group bacterium]
MIINKLIDAGLEEKEARVYAAILELGEATIAQITQKSAIKRSTVYEMLELLKKKGLISQTKKKKRPYFLAENPKKLLDRLEERKKSLQQAMPEILSLMNLLDNKPKIRYFEGLAGVKEVFEDTLEHSDEEILTWFPYPYINLGEDYFWGHYLKERLEKRIFARAIIPDNEANRRFAQEMKEKAITKTRFVKDHAFSGFDLEIKIYGKSKLGIISYQEDLGIIIESKKIYDGLKAIFETMWNGLPEENNYINSL